MVVYDMIKEGSASVASAVDPKAAVLSRKPTMESEALQHPGLRGGSAQAFSPTMSACLNCSPEPFSIAGGPSLTTWKNGGLIPYSDTPKPGLLWFGLDVLAPLSFGSLRVIGFLCPFGPRWSGVPMRPAPSTPWMVPWTKGAPLGP